jgi:hypothetical protein
MKAFYMHDDGDLYKVEDTVVRRVEESKPGPDGKPIVQKVTKIFTKSGKELKTEMPPPPPNYGAPAVPTFRAPEKLDINENFLREGAQTPKVKELPMPKPGEAQPKLDDQGRPVQPKPDETPKPKPGAPATPGAPPLEAPKPVTPSNEKKSGQ